MNNIDRLVTIYPEYNFFITCLGMEDPCLSNVLDCVTEELMVAYGSVVSRLHSLNLFFMIHHQSDKIKMTAMNRATLAVVCQHEFAKDIESLGKWEEVTLKDGETIYTSELVRKMQEDYREKTKAHLIDFLKKFEHMCFAAFN